MSLTVDTNNISLECKNLDRYIKEYSENSYDIFYELSKLNSYWKDEKSSLFEGKINKEKESNLLIMQSLQEINNFYKQIEDIYDKKI